MAITKSEDIDAWPQSISDPSEQKDEENLDTFLTKAIQSEQKAVIKFIIFWGFLKKSSYQTNLC